MKVSINNKYCIRNEKGCSYIICKTTLSNIKEKSFPAIMPIPPIYGYILSFFNGEEIDYTISKIENCINVEKEKIAIFISKILGNTCAYITYINGIKVYLPSFLLVEDRYKSDTFSEDDFYPYDRFTPKRPSRPFFINLMITSKCYTNCIYCYADRHRQDDMDLESVLKIIDNAKKEKIPNILISGGDVLATKNWQIILKKLTLFGYPQIISTKVPLQEDDITCLKNNNINRIQISIDSFDDYELFNMVRVNNSYLRKMKQTFRYAEKLNLSIDIKTVLTKYNANIRTLKNMYEELLKYKCIKSWNIVPAFFSSHNELDYNTYKVDIETLNILLDFLKNIKPPFEIEYKKIKDAIFVIQKRYTSEAEFVKKNKGCIANIYGLSVISNGKATICEMLYYNENFYIGDAKKESFKKIWNSNLASRFNFRKKIEKINSPCYSCNEFDKCKRSNLKKTCIVDVINTYGTDKWEYPDPRCPRSTSVNVDKVIY